MSNLISIDYGSISGVKGYYSSNTTPTTPKVACGFKPKFIMLETLQYGNGGTMATAIYDENISTTEITIHYGNSAIKQAIGQSNIASIDNDGFTLGSAYTSWINGNIVAIG